MKYIITLTLGVSLVLLTTASKAQMRLTAKANRTYVSSGNIVTDSFVYFHSGPKGASPGKYKIPEFELMEDSMYQYGNSGGSVKLVGKRISTYTGTDFNQSIYYEWDDAGNKWENDRRTRIVYKGGKPDTVYYETWGSMGGGSWRRSSAIVYTWSGNNIATRLRLTYSFGGGGNPPGWRNNRLHTYTWSGNDETSFIDQKWESGAWKDSMKRETTYAAGKVSQVDFFLSNSGTWTPQRRELYNYDGNSRLTHIQQDIYTGTWEVDNARDTFFYNGTAAFPDTMVRVAKIFPPNFTNVGKWGYEYLVDNSGRLTMETSLSWDGIGSWKQTNNQDSINNWYYGWPATVEGLEEANDRLNLYPSPASQNIHINLSGIERGKQVQLAIVDMQGRLLKNWMAEAGSEISTTVSELPAGNYLLYATDGTFKASQKFVVAE